MVALFRTCGADNSPKELFISHSADYDGYGGSSYIDTVICRDRDSNSGWANAGDGTLERRDYYCHNWRGDVICLITSTGGMVEWVRYSAYGEPCLIINGDTNGDFTVNSADTSNINNNWGSSNYPTGDFNLNGTIDTDDLMNVIVTQWGKSGGWGLLTHGGISGSIANRKGYAGYEHLAALTRTKWDVRYRVLDSLLGRWNRRDPAKENPINHLSYVWQNPITMVDPQGLLSVRPPKSIFPTPWGPLGPGAACIAKYAIEVGICNTTFPPGSAANAVCIEIANFQYQACNALVDLPIDAPGILACWNPVLTPAGWGFCTWYPLCDSHYGVNFQCMCMCMGNAPWSMCARTCIQCMISGGVHPFTAHAVCWARCTSLWGPPPAQTLATCGAACFIYQQCFCPPGLETY